jgi:hypothetical protein
MDAVRALKDPLEGINGYVYVYYIHEYVHMYV